MADKTSYTPSLSFWGIFFWLYFAIKWFGTALAAWSWWWLLLPYVPVFYLLVKNWGL